MKIVDQSILILIVGLILWYGIKYTYLFGTNRKSDWYVRLPYFVVCAGTVIFATVLYALPSCSYNIHIYAAYTIIVSSAALVVDALDGSFSYIAAWSSHPLRTLSPAHTAIIIAMFYLSGAAVQSNEPTACSVATASGSVAFMTALVFTAMFAKGGFLERGNSLDAQWTVPSAANMKQVLHAMHHNVAPEDSGYKITDATTGEIKWIKKF